MKNNLKYSLPALILIVISAVGFSWRTVEDDKEKMVMRLLYDALSSIHYEPKDFDDDLSSQVFDFYIKSLDSQKRFLHKSDIKDLSDFKLKLDDELRLGSTEFFDKSIEIALDRFDEAKERYRRILSTPMDFSSKDFFETDSDKREYPEDETQMENFWMKYLKFRVLSRLYDRAESSDSANKIDFNLNSLGFQDEERKAREKELEIHNEWFANMAETERSDLFGLFINSYTGVFDPHTQYFAPRQKEQFEIELSGQLEGIGASLRQEGEFTEVVSIVTGSACWRQGDLEVGDKLLKVAQGDAEPEDIVGMGTTKVVSKVRGKKGTEVRLTVRKKDGSEKVISIIRDIVEIEATFARSAVIGEDKGTGYIRLPKFYVDFYKDSNRDCAEDVKNEIIKLKNAGIKNLIFDLRGNGGGSLNAAINIAGLFIDRGPMVQVKTSGQKVKSYNDQEDGTTWDGPLIILVNEGTASASEIVAAALQDYGRAIVVGTSRTFGKGTVQNILDLDRAAGPFNSGLRPLGALKLTIQKYYRVSGGTTQLEGVHSDIVLPHPYENIPFGEREMEFPLSVDNVSPANYDILSPTNFDEVIANSHNRISSNTEFNQIKSYASWIESQQKKTNTTLDYQDYFEREKALDLEIETYSDILKSDTELDVNWVNSAYKSELDSSKVIEYEKWFKSLSQDIYLAEGWRVVNDIEES
jgi:carboxyl-terminal processing protease|tara:strand:+ start:3824 stop:5914 length:2091 start_codon:yes stop_codon:yes gene_type:complete